MRCSPPTIPTVLSGLFIVLQPFDIIFQRENQQQGTRAQGRTHAIYSAAATGNGPRVPDAHHEFVTETVVQVTTRQDTSGERPSPGILTQNFSYPLIFLLLITFVKVTNQDVGVELFPAHSTKIESRPFDM